MSLMSRKVDYALLILAYLDQKREGGCAREIADRYGLSKGFVANILKLLCHAEFVTSHRGVKGGYVMSRPAEQVSLAELMEALDEGFHLAECTRSSAMSDTCTIAAVCPVNGAIADVHRRIRDLLRGVTLAEVIRPRSPVNAAILGLNLVSADKLLAVE
jgi:Rrf2 family transcriptional regulator, cysteine metabolism repressor